MGVPTLGVGTVLSRSLSPWGVYVLFPSLQSSGVLVRMGIHGQADAVRVSQKPLPKEGTSGLILFPFGDSRNAVWICSLYTQQNDAHPNVDVDTDYEAYPSGAWKMLDGEGNFSFVLPDGTALTTNPAGLPTPTRNVVQADQTQVPQPFPTGQRTQSAISPRPLVWTMPSGQTVTFDVNGGITLATKAGQPFTIDGTTVVNGDIQVTGSIQATADVIAAVGAAQVSLLNHITSEVTHGTGISGPPVPGT
jgi:phage baseplate assembly protein gpV